jgi:hypothetical protein
MASERPDQVVYNDEMQHYDAFLKPYATNLGAPSIVLEDTAGWKQNGVRKANAEFRSKFMELKADYNRLLESLQINELIFNAAFSFEPVPGEIYHLYRNAKGKSFLSILAPNECSFDFLGSFRLNSDRLWKRVEKAPQRNL